MSRVRFRHSRHVAFVALANAFVGSADMSAEPASKIAQNGNEPYQTMCVRACDGFYFPIRQNAVRGNFAADANACRSACQSEARLFYFPRAGGSPTSMIDIDGRKYADEPNAFAFRAGVNPSCSCRPAPWSEAAKARHNDYAVKEIKARREAEVAAAARAAAEAAKTTAEISAAATRHYYETDARASGRAEQRSVLHRPDAHDDTW